jgi:PTH1 family peptidyl-tRNA hydrolase
MKLIVGLGNIGAEYQNTRHNVGFVVLDSILQKIPFTKINKNNFYGDVYKSGEYLFLKPSTYMNLSGKSVSALKNFYKIPNQDIVVIHDDLDLKIGALRFKYAGSSGGHNGLKSIDSFIGNEYWRIRIGIGRPENKSDVIGYVLGNFQPTELQKLDKVIENCEKAIFDWDEKTSSKYSLKG